MYCTACWVVMYLMTLSNLVCSLVHLYLVKYFRIKYNYFTGSSARKTLTKKFLSVLDLPILEWTLGYTINLIPKCSLFWKDLAIAKKKLSFGDYRGALSSLEAAKQHDPHTSSDVTSLVRCRNYLNLTIKYRNRLSIDRALRFKLIILIFLISSFKKLIMPKRKKASASSTCREKITKWCQLLFTKII